MLEYRSVAQNGHGWSFAFTWRGSGTVDEAQAELDRIVACDAAHMRHGPWVATHTTRSSGQ
jgi:hypothetical protein